VHALRVLVQLGIVLGLALAGFGYWALATGALAAGLIETAAVIYASGWRPRLTRPGLRARGLLAFGIHISLASLLWFVYSHADQAIIGKLAGPVALGYYALAFQLISLPVQKLTAHANQVAYPVFCRLQHDRRRLRDWYLRLAALLACLGMPALAGMALVAEDAFAVIFGAKWLPAVTPFQLLSVAGMIMIFSNSLPPLLNALGRPDINFRYTALCALVFPAGFLLLGIPYGLIGICLVWLILYPIMVGGLVHLTRRFSGFDLVDVVRIHLPVLLGVLAMTGVVLSLQWGMSEVSSAGWRLASTVAAGAATYVGVMAVLARRTILADVYLLVREIKG
jgi:O-antigen/teichoic acid export membrane protein